MESFLCPEAEWVHEVAPNGTIQIQCCNLPDWLKKEDPTLDAPEALLLSHCSQVVCGTRRSCHSLKAADPQTTLALRHTPSGRDFLQWFYFANVRI